MGNERLAVLWEPGFKNDMLCMEGFDNVVKWKADYTKEWIENKLLKKAHEFWSEQHKRSGFNILKRLKNI